MEEHLIVPAGAKTVKQAVGINLKANDQVGKLLTKKEPGFAGGPDDENVWAENMNDVEVLEVIWEAMERISDAKGVEIRMAWISQRTV